MRKKLLLLTLLTQMLLISCLSDKQIIRNYDRFAALAGKTEVKTSVRDTTVEVDHQVVIPISPDSVTYTGLVNVVNGTAQMAPVEVKSRWIKSTVAISDGKLEMKSRLIKRELPTRIKAMIRIPGAIREVSRTTAIDKKVIPKFYRFSFWVVIAVLALVAIWIGRKLNLFTLFKKLLKIN